MDLRKSVLQKQQAVLSDSIVNISNISAYESAAEDIDTTLYYSFNNDSVKTFDISGIAADDSEINNSMCSNADKENTIIQQRQSIQTERISFANKSETIAEEATLKKAIEMRENSSVKNEQLLEQSSVRSSSIMVTVVEDPQENKTSEDQIMTEQTATDLAIACNVAEAAESSQLIDEISPPADLVNLSFEGVFDVVNDGTETVGEAPVESSDEMSQEAAQKDLKDAASVKSIADEMHIEEVADKEEETKSEEVPVKTQSTEIMKIEKVPQEPAQTNVHTQTAFITSTHFQDEMKIEETPVEMVSVHQLPAEVLISVDSPMMEVKNPNENIVNPFTALPAPPVNVIEKRVTRRSVVSTKIPSKTFLYSPVMRRSIDRRGKPPATRRTILLQQDNKPGPSRGSGSAKATAVLPKPTMVKPKTFKCSFASCFNEEFPTMKAYQEHQKTHRSANIATTKSSFNCKWCDKKFQLENALVNHQTESCPKIPAVEKRKILSQRDKKEKDRRRTTLFAPPMLKRKSPMRRPITEMNRSGIKITPKKSLKCHLCNEIVHDAVSLANHILTHKFNRDNGIKEVQ
jgi:hypothetical protein